VADTRLPSDAFNWNIVEQRRQLLREEGGPWPCLRGNASTRRLGEPRRTDFLGGEGQKIGGPRQRRGAMNAGDGERSPKVRFTRGETERILDRLIELDQLEERGLSRQEIHEVAQELGIARELVDRAVVERTAARRDDAAREGFRVRSPLREALLLAVLGAGAFLPTAVLGVSHLPGILGVGILSIALGLDSRRPDAWSRFRIRNLGLWAGFVAGGSTLFSMGPDAALALFIGLPVLGGAGMIALGQWMSAGDRGSPGQHRRALLSRTARMVSRLFGGVREGIGLLKTRFGIHCVRERQMRFRGRRRYENRNRTFRNSGASAR
jgi:hypothetical protein